MNNDNLQYLSDNIKYMGFGENLKTALETNMKEGKADFRLHFNGEMGKKPFNAVLNFRKSDTTDMYFFNNYKASMELLGGEKREQTFYINKGKGVTAKEAFNLMEGRSVLKELTTKEGNAYKAWVQLDPENKDKHNNMEMKQYHENYGYDVKAAVGKLAVAELNDPEKEKTLMQSLQKGNIQAVTLEKDESSMKVFVEANPQYKNVNVYGMDLKPIMSKELEKYQVNSLSNSAAREALGPDKKKELKAENGQSSDKIKKNTESLLPKKRESTKKGLSI